MLPGILVLLSFLSAIPAATLPDVSRPTEHGPIRVPLRRKVGSADRVAKRAGPNYNTINNLDPDVHLFAIDVELGTPPQTLHMGLSFASFLSFTGGTPLAIANKCSDFGSKCNIFQPNASTTFNGTGVTYTRAGYPVRSKWYDTFKLGDTQLDNQELGILNMSDPYNERAIDRGAAGYISLNMGGSILPALLEDAGSKEMGLFVAQPLPKDFIVGSDGTDYSVGELLIGGLNTELYTGEIHYLPMLNRSLSTVRLDELRVGNQKIILTPSTSQGSDVGAVLQIDPDADNIRMGWNVYDQIVRATYNAQGTPPTDNITTEDLFYCNPKVNLTLVLGGREYIIPWKRWMYVFDLGPEVMPEPICFPAIMPYYNNWTMPYSPEVNIAIGPTFLNSVYTAFNMDEANPQIGFAQLSEAAKRFMPVRQLSPTHSVTSVSIPRPTAAVAADAASRSSSGTVPRLTEPWPSVLAVLLVVIVMMSQ